MRKHLFLCLIACLTALLGLAACSPAGQRPVTSAPPTEDKRATSERSVSQTGGYAGPVWTELPLVNARTGETFTLADFAGKTVFLKPMAIW